MTARLPVVGGDTGAWGTVLDAYLSVGHNADGTHPLPSADDAVWLIGDSITANGYTAPTGGNGPIYTPLSVGMWASIQSGGKLRLGGIAATGGYTSAQVLATHVPTVLAASPRPKFCVVLCGTNDVALGNTGPSIANLTAIYAALAAAGITPVCCTLTPRSTAAGSAAYPMLRLNQWIIRYAALHGWPLVDYWAATAGTDGDWLAGYKSDDVHPGGIGARVMGNTLQAALAPLLPAQSGQLPNAVSWPSLATPTNSIFSLDTNADGLADGYSFSGGHGTSVAALTAKGAGEGVGQWQNLTRGNADIFVQSAGFDLVAGNRMLLAFQFKTSGMEANSATYEIRLFTNDNAFQIFSFNADLNAADLAAAGALVAEFTVPSNASLPTCKTWFAVRTAAGGVLSIGQYALIDLTANGLV